MSAPTLSILLPAYNEEARLPGLLNLIRDDATEQIGQAGFELIEALVIDDGSSDGTAEILKERAVELPRLRVAGWSGNRGKGAAVAEGMRLARGDYSLQADIDLSTPLSDLVQLARAIEDGADIAFGSRELEGAVVEAPLRRRLLGRVFNLIVRLMTGLRFRDTQCGFKLMPTELGRRLLREQICTGFAYDVELLYRAKLAGLTAVEVPVSYIHDFRSRVKVATTSPLMLFDVARLVLALRRRPTGHSPTSNA